MMFGFLYIRIYRYFMTDKLIFWLDVNLLHFGISKFLQEKYDAKFFAMYDLPYTQKESYIDQKIVNFQKIWFYRDHISKPSKKPDMDYLKKMEEKYNLNLWMLAYYDAVFYDFNPYHRFTDYEILSIMEQEFKFFESVIDEVKPDFLLTLTSEGRSQRFAEICKAKGVKVLMLNGHRLGLRATISSEVEIVDDFATFEYQSSTNKGTLNDIRNYMKAHSSYDTTKKIESGGKNLSLIHKLGPTISFLNKTNSKEYQNFYVHYGRTKWRMLQNGISSLLKSWYRERFMNNNFVRKLPEDEKFVYFPMHLYPERSVLVAVPFYTDQLEVISNIAKSLPVSYKLYVKEHVVQRYYNWRSISYYKKILDLPNVRLIHPSVNPEELERKCSLVVSIYGTTGLEAILHKKSAIVLSDVDYRNLPSVHRLRNIEDLPKAIRSALEKEVDPLQLNEYMNFIDGHSFEFDFFLISYITSIFYHKGFSHFGRISMNEVNSFFEEHKNEFQKLALEHIKKIKQYKDKKSN